MHLTTRGWSFVLASVGLYAAGRTLGTVELAMLAAAGAVVLALAVGVVSMGQPDVRARRLLRPNRLHAGTAAHAEIELKNLGRRHTAVISITDRFTGRREARFAVAPLRPRESARGGYRIPTSHRGIFAVGPLRVGVTDPLGLVRRVIQSDPREEVTIYPRIEAVAALPLTLGRDLLGGAVTEFSRARAGTEFHSLREYQIGDDLRRVHWRSTARTGKLMIKEHDVPWQTRATLLLDDRSTHFAPPSFERAVEAVASVATALHQGRAILRLITTRGLDTGFGAGHDHYQAIMEQLAVVEPAGNRFDEVAARLHRQGNTGALLAFTGAVDAEDLTKLGTLERRFGFVGVVRFGDGTAAPLVPGLTVIDVPAGTAFASVWNQVMVAGPGARR